MHKWQLQERGSCLFMVDIWFLEKKRWSWLFLLFCKISWGSADQRRHCSNIPAFGAKTNWRPAENASNQAGGRPGIPLWIASLQLCTLAKGLRSEFRRRCRSSKTRVNATISRSKKYCLPGLLGLQELHAMNVRVHCPAHLVLGIFHLSLLYRMGSLLNVERVKIAPPLDYVKKTTMTNHLKL